MPTLGLCSCCQKEVSNEAKFCPHCGQPDPYDSEYDIARKLKLNGNRIDAIKIIRKMIGCDLKTAQDIFDRL